MFYVTGTSKQDLFNTAEKTKESIVDDVGNCDFKTLSISPPDTSPDSFHEVPVDCPEEVPVDVPENKTHAKQGHVQVRLLRTRRGGQGVKHSNNCRAECRLALYSKCMKANNQILPSLNKSETSHLYFIHLT